MSVTDFLDNLNVFHDRFAFHNSKDKTIFREGTETFRKKKKKIARSKIAFSFLSDTTIFVICKIFYHTQMTSF